MDINNLTLAEVVALANEENPAKILASIPTDKRDKLVNDICVILRDSGLSFRQAELLLDVTKGRLLHWKMR